MFALLFRFVVIPMTLFAGVFFPVEQLPAPARWLAYVSPLWHGVELCRAATLGTATALVALPAHVAVPAAVGGRRLPARAPPVRSPVEAGRTDGHHAGRCRGVVAARAPVAGAGVGHRAQRRRAAARAYWLVLVSGFLEPVLYLLSIGVGVGQPGRRLTLADGRVVTYAAFVAPAMLAASAMNGALAETTFNFFVKMKS